MKRDELKKEIEKIQEYIDSGEDIIVISRQKRLVPGGSPVTPNTIFATTRKLIIRNPMMFGLRENIEYFHYSDIINIKLEKGIFSSTLVVTTPGMGTAARPPKGSAPWGRSEDGMIDGIEHNDAKKIIELVRNNMRGRNANRTNS